MTSRQLLRVPEIEGSLTPYPVNSATVIEVGDLLYLEVDDVRPASAMTYGATLPATQIQFARKFVGVAATPSANGETEPVMVRGGIFEFDCAAAQFEIGDFVGPDDNAAPDALLDQQVIAVGPNGIGIGRVIKRYGVNTTRVLVAVHPHGVLPVHPASQVQRINLGTFTLGTALDLITAMPVIYPFKIVGIITIVTTVMVGSAEVLTLKKNSTALDDTHTVGAAAALGVVGRTAISDSTGDDIFDVGDTFSLVSDGGSTSGAVSVILEIKPFLNES